MLKTVNNTKEVAKIVSVKIHFKTAKWYSLKYTFGLSFVISRFRNSSVHKCLQCCTIYRCRFMLYLVFIIFFMLISLIRIFYRLHRKLTFWSYMCFKKDFEIKLREIFSKVKTENSKNADYVYKSKLRPYLNSFWVHTTSHIIGYLLNCQGLFER